MELGQEAETWRAVEDWPGYQVSDLGRVRSVDRTLPSGQFCAGTVLKQSRDSHGYMRVTLRNGRKASTKRVHVLVMKAFAGPRPAGMHILHRNDDQQKNDMDSLRYGSQSENEKEKKGKEKGQRRRRKGDRRERGRKEIGYRKGSPRDTSPESQGVTPESPSVQTSEFPRFRGSQP